jgi:acetyl esterase
MPVDPIIKELQAAVGDQSSKPSIVPAEWRAQAIATDRFMAEKAYDTPPEVDLEDLTISTPDAGEIHLRIYRPRGAGDGSAVNALDAVSAISGSGQGAGTEGSTALLPMYLGFFGGAFRQGGLDFPSIDTAFRSRAHDVGIAVVGVDYALAPEHPFPAAPEQGYAALTWLAEHGAEHGIDGTRIAIGGMSSGGNIAAAVALMSRDRGGPALRLQLLEVPALDLTGDHLDLKIGRSLGVPPFFLKVGLKKMGREYLGSDRAAVRLPYASPLLAESLAGLPPTRIMTAEFDVLRGDGEAYAARLREYGVDASATRFIGQTHESSFFTAILPGARHWRANVNAALAEFLGQN